jgi:hypothetical protein
VKANSSLQSEKTAKDRSERLHSYRLPSSAIELKFGLQRKADLGKLPNLVRLSFQFIRFIGRIVTKATDESGFAEDS